MIVGAIMVPHPPIAVAEVGKGEEKKIQKTLDAYELAAAFVASKRPDTIVMISPHALMYRDYFNVSDGARADGTLIGFGAGEVRVDVTYDREFTYELTNLLEEESFPGGTEYDQEPSLSPDHGTMVPLYFLQKKYRDFKMVRLGLSGLTLTEHYRMGQYVAEIAAKLKRRVVVIASGDLSHCQKSDGPYGYRPEGEDYDQRIMEDMGSANFGNLLEYNGNFLNEAMECGHRSFTILAGILDGKTVLPHVLSHEATFGVGYGIVTFEVGTEDKMRCFLKNYQEAQLQKLNKKRERADAYATLAYASVEAWVTERTQLGMNHPLCKALPVNAAAVFVSIHKDGELRGCIGTIKPTCTCVAEEIVRNAISACTRDPRFAPVETEELPYLEISVDVLSEMVEIKNISELNVKRYGILVTLGDKSGLLLPDLEGVDTVGKQIEIACSKGGFRPDPRMKIERFEVVRHV